MSIEKVYGKVERILRKNIQNKEIMFKVSIWDTNTKTYNGEMHLSYVGFLPLFEEDIIFAVYSKLKEDNIIINKIIKPPFVTMPVDDESIIKIITKMSTGSFGYIKARNLLSFLKTTVDSKGERDACCFLDDISSKYHQEKDPEEAKDIVNLISEPHTNLSNFQAKDLLTKWYKIRNIRRLWLLGLTNSEIKACKMSHDDIFSVLKTNPYVLSHIKIEKCDEIITRIGQNINDAEWQEKRYCGLILRKVNEYIKNKAWSCVPISTIKSFYALDKYKDKLLSEYGCVEDMGCIYTTETYESEKGIADWLEEINRDEDFNYDPIYTRRDLTEEQKECIKQVFQHNVSIIKGKAGTGKTTIIKEIVANLDLIEEDYIIASFTGKAVARIKKVVGKKNVGTMNKIIATYSERSASDMPKFKWLIIDEISMITTDLLWKFRKTFNHSYNLIMIGDSNQLETISNGSLMNELVRSDKFFTFELTNIQRQSKNSAILKNADKIIDSKDIESGDDFILKNGNETTVLEEIKSLVDNGYNPYDITIITPFNESVDKFNDECRKIYHANRISICDSKGKRWYEGDRVMMNTNNYEINVMNGEEGIIRSIDKINYTVKIKFDSNDEEQEFDLNIPQEAQDDEDEKNENFSMKSVSPSSAITVHRSQGSEWDHVFIYIPQNTRSFVTKNLLYTAVTRGKQKVWCIGNIASINIASKTMPDFRYENLAKRINPSISSNDEDENYDPISSLMI